MQCLRKASAYTVLYLLYISTYALAFLGSSYHISIKLKITKKTIVFKTANNLHIYLFSFSETVVPVSVMSNFCFLTTEACRNIFTNDNVENLFSGVTLKGRPLSHLRHLISRWQRDQYTSQLPESLFSMSSTMKHL